MSFLKVHEVFFISVLFIFSFLKIDSQERESLKRKISEIESEINYLNRLLEENEGSKKVYTNNIILLERKIGNQEKYIIALESEMENIKKVIGEYESMIEELQTKYKFLGEAYGKAVKNYYFKKDKVYLWVYILAAENYIQAQKRYLFYKQFISEIKEKGNSLKLLMIEINEKKNKLNGLLNEKSKLLGLKEMEKKKMEDEKRKETLIIEKLKKNEVEIRKKINEKTTIAKRLEKEMKKIIEEEVKRSKGNKLISLTKEEKIIAGNFEKNMGKLPWPVEKGIIVEKYGEHVHPVLKNVKVRNNGIDIETEKNTVVKTIYEGVVSKIVSILGAKYTIIIRHGNYLTVYQNIDNVFVKNGEKVDMGQSIGEVVGLQNEENPIIHFEIWKDFTRMNPEEWIKVK
ncbi:MAG: murein hydrolase activator EnvC family protein [Bacteroidales bacterium]